MLVSTEQMRQLEALTDRSGISYADMMESAGKALADAIVSHFPDCHRILLLAGSGNNGGDCYVAARYLKQAGKRPELLAPCGRPRTGIARAALDRAKTEGIPVYAQAYDFLFTEPELVVDGLFGTGFRGELPADVQELLAKIARKHHVACDIPSGGSGDTGAVSPGTLRAELTVTFGGEKIGMRQYPLRDYCGRIVTADIGIPSDAAAQLDPPVIAELTTALADRLLPVFPADVHKHRRGHVLAVCGSVRMRGACVLSVTAAMRSGAGLVTCASAEPALAGVCARVPEVMCLPMETDAKGFLRFAENRETLTEAMEGKQVLLLGCGLGVTDETRELTRFLLRESGCTVILDADGMNCVGTCIEWIPEGRTILTPHPGEAARMLGIRTAEVQADRPGAAKELAARTGAVVVLKGAGTIVTDGRRMAVCSLGNAGLAKAGSGDVLAGMTAAFAAQGMAPYEAACAAVTFHAAAGDAAAAKLPARCMLPQDVICAFPDVF